MVGLGRMGGNMTKRLIEGGHQVVAHDRSADALEAIAKDGAQPASSLADLVKDLDAPRAAWVMVPSGAPTQSTIDELGELLSPGDVIIDGGNSHYVDGLDRAAKLKERGIGFIDAGVSGGVWGLKIGYCLMVGGERDVVQLLEPVFRTLAPEDGYAHVGPPGAGHYVKMIHNGIEYGMLQAYAEGFALLEAAPEFGLDLHQIAGIWRYGSVVRSWLLELLHAAFEQEGHELEKVAGYVEDSGEGRWTITEAINESVPVPVITAALFARFASRQDESFAAKVTAALRKQFGGHQIREVK